MGFYFDYAIEKKDKDNKWKCVSKSCTDYSLNLLDTRLMWEAFHNDSVCDTMKITDEPTVDSFTMFGKKTERTDEPKTTDYPYQYKPRISRPIPFSMDALDNICDGASRYDDLILWFDSKSILEFGKDLLTIYVRCDDGDFEINDEKSLTNKIPNWKNCVYNPSSGLLGINFECSADDLAYMLRHSALFKRIIKNVPLDKLIVEISTVRYKHDKKTIPQFYYDVKIAYPKDIERKIDEIDRRMNNFQMSAYIENESKRRISCMLDQFKHDNMENSTLFYHKMKEWCDKYDDKCELELVDELKNQKKELIFLLKILGDNGRLVWSVE